MSTATATATTTDLASRVRARLAQDPKVMTMQLAREFGVPEADVIRSLPEGQTVELDAARWEEVIRDLANLGQVHVISSNGTVTLECFGEFGNFSTWGDYFNVQTKSLDMHIRFREIAAIFAVEKPSHMDGVNTISLQFYDRRGGSAFKVFLTFGGKAPPAEKFAGFKAIREKFKLSA